MTMTVTYDNLCDIFALWSQWFEWIMNSLFKRLSNIYERFDFQTFLKDSEIEQVYVKVR